MREKNFFHLNPSSIGLPEEEGSLKMISVRWNSERAWGSKNSFLEGYAFIRKVPDYKRMMPLLHLSRAVAAVGFTVKRGIWESRNSKLYQFNFRYLESLAGGEKA